MLSCASDASAAAKRTTTTISGANYRPRKHAYHLLISHGTRVRKRALVSQVVTPNRPTRCDWSFVTPRRPHADRQSRAARLNTHATTLHHSQGSNFRIHFPESLNPPLASVSFWFGRIGTWMESTDRTNWLTSELGFIDKVKWVYELHG